jgi:hypothetical protein
MLELVAVVLNQRKKWVEEYGRKAERKWRIEGRRREE